MSTDEKPTYKTCDGVTPQCPVEATLYGDYFDLGACIFFTISFGLLLSIQAFLGYRSRAWSFATYLAIGTIFEFAGYAARIALNQNPWQFGAFVVQLLLLILGPTLVAAAISITCKHLVLYYGPEGSLIAPRWYPWVFVGTDFVSILIQAVGASVAGTATGSESPNSALQDTSAGLLVAGVSFQLANMAVCGVMMFVYWRRLAKRSQPGSKSDVSNGFMGKLRRDKVFGFVVSCSTAYMAIVIRCIYRIPEMASGWGSDLMQDEITFLVFDGTMVLIAIILLTLIHPYYFFPEMASESGESESVIALQERDITWSSMTGHGLHKSDASAGIRC